MTTRVLIVYYSLTGHTAALAKELAHLLPGPDVDIEPLVEPKPRSGWRGLVRSVVDSINRRVPVIAPPRARARDYDVVLLGTPIWMGRISSPARAFLATEAFGGARLSMFFTSGGPVQPSAFAEVEDLHGEPLPACLELRTHEVLDATRLQAFLIDSGALSLPSTRDHLRAA